MKEKGIKILVSIFLFASVLMPFSVSAAEQTQIVPTWNWGSQYANQFTVTNFCEGSGTNVSCELRFTANNSYYGYLSFDGYNGTTKWIDYKNVWIADGYGAYRYSLYQNGVIQINKINIEGGYIKSSMDNLDLQDIIDLLTAIETDTTSIDNQINTELQRLQSIINNQIIQNGYLETLIKLRQWHMPIESYGYVSDMLSLHQSENIFTYNFYDYPVVRLTNGDSLVRTGQSANKFYVIIGSNRWFSTSNFNTLTSCNYTLDSITLLNAGYFNIFKFEFSRPSSNLQFQWNWIYSADLLMIPIFFNNSTERLSTDFALNYGFSNQLLDNINIIAQGTQQSDAAASGLDQNTNQMQSDFNSYYSIENTANSDFNSALNGINFNDQIAGNQSFLDSASFVKTVFSSMMQIPILSTFVIILCIVLMARIFL